MADEKAIVLYSRDAFESKHMPRSLKSWLKLYGNVWGLAVSGMYLFGDLRGNEWSLFAIGTAIWLIVIFVVLIVISRIRNRSNVDEAVGEIRSMKFKLGDSLSVDDFYSKIQSDSVQVYFSGATFERDGDKIFAHYDGRRYDIILNGDGTFSVIGKIASDPNKAFYDEIRKGTPIIAFGLQQAFGVK